MAQPIRNIGDVTSRPAHGPDHASHSHGVERTHGIQPSTQVGAVEPTTTERSDGVALSGQAQARTEYRNHGQMVREAAHQGIHGKDLARIARGEVSLEDFVAQRDAAAPVVEAGTPQPGAPDQHIAAEPPVADPAQAELSAQFEQFKANMNSWLEKFNLG